MTPPQYYRNTFNNKIEKMKTRNGEAIVTIDKFDKLWLIPRLILVK